MINIFSFFRGKGLGKEENGRVKPVQVEQKQNVKGIGYGTEGAFEPWWDDLYNKTAIGTSIKKENKKKDSKDKKGKKVKKDKQDKKDKKVSKKEKNNERKSSKKEKKASKKVEKMR